MAAPYICLPCRTKLLLPRLRQQRLISYTAAERSTAQTRNGTAPIGDSPGPHQRGPRLESQRAPARGRYSGKQLKPQELLPFLSRHEETRARSNHDRNAPSPQNRDFRPRAQEAVLPELDEKSRIVVHSVQNHDLPRAWDALHGLALMCSKLPPTQSALLILNTHLRNAITALGENVIRQWLATSSGGSATSSLPLPSQLFSTLSFIQPAGAGFYYTPLWDAVSGVFEMQLEQSQLEIALKELLNMWRICSAARLAREVAQGNEPISTGELGAEANWTFLPSPATFASIAPETRSYDMFENMLNMLVPISQNDDRRPSSRFSRDYTSSALLTLDLLRHGVAGASPSIAKTPLAIPFVTMLETMLAAAQAPNVPILLKLRLQHVQDEELWKRYQMFCQRLNLVNIPSTRPTVDSEDIPRGEPDSQSSSIERFAAMCNSRLGKAVELQKPSMVEQIQGQIYARAKELEPNTTAIPLDLFEVLMGAYLTLHNFNKAVEVWRFITKAGYKPTAKTYTVVMRGAQASRDISGMEKFWQHMRQSGVQPDPHAWSVRVFGLLKGRKSMPQGLQALSEMGREWFAAAKTQYVRDMGNVQKKQAASQGPSASDLIMHFPGDVNGIPRPNLAIMNTAISALAQQNDNEIHKVLAWGRSFGIEPDLTTYNALLNISMRHSRADDAMKLLHRMHSKGIQADSTTWTILLTSLFHNGFIDGLSPLEQQEKIMTFITSLDNEELGMTGIDSKGYALIIDRLLKTYSNPNAATAVLTHMLQRGQEPSAHIYTILMTSHFQRSDLPAVEGLWKQIQARDKGWGAKGLDGYFFDRMIEGYAHFHRAAGLQPALDFLRRSKEAGNRPGWKAMEALVRALAERSDWARLKGLVDETRRSLGSTRVSDRMDRGQRTFWETVIGTGILRDEGIGRPEQLLPGERSEVSPLFRWAEEQERENVG